MTKRTSKKAAAKKSWIKTSAPKKSPPKKSAAKKSTRKKSAAQLPGPHFGEQVMREILGGGSDRRFDAQEHAYAAMDAMANEDWERAQREAMAAIKMDPNCVDALHVMSQLGSESKSELIDNLRRTVARGEKSLGKTFFEENVGWFWGLLETRPYMRARAELAGLLHQTGEAEEAIAHWEEMLRLNPGDNQGLRYPLLGSYLELGNRQGAQRLFSEYPDEGSAMFAWARVLADLLAGDEAAATRSLTAARKANEHVEAFLTGRKKTPIDGPGYYSPGELSEAIVCMHEIGSAWKKHPAAVEWLKQQKAK